MKTDCVVIGGGPAGLTAALYLRRFERSVELIDANESRMRWIPTTHNYLGFPAGISGGALLQAMRQQYEHIAGSVRQDRVQTVVRHGDDFEVALDSGATLQTSSLVLATGVKDNEPIIPGVDAVRTAGLLRQCPVCDAYDYTDQHIAVLGNSRHSVNEAVFLRHFTSSISFFAMQRATFPSELIDELKAARIAFIAQSPTLLAVRPDKTVAITTGTGTQYRFQALYAALGVIPRIDLAKQLGVRLDDCDCVIVDEQCRTSVGNVYAAGDLVRGLNQINVSTAQGAVAATAIHQALPQLGRAPATLLREK